MTAEFIAALRAHTAPAGSRLASVITGLEQPIRVRVTGRPGVGRATTTAALRAAGVAIALAASADVMVLVIAETVKPEDRRIYTDSATPVLIVLNKADLLADPAGRAATIARQTGLPVVPCCAHADIGAVLAGIASVSALMRYRRLRTALRRLHAVAATDPGLADLLAGDAAVLAVSTAAAEVLWAAGLDPDAGDAVRWQRYSRGPVDALHRDCGADLARRALRP